jgi:PAS domain S-box-containing protein
MHMNRYQSVRDFLCLENIILCAVSLVLLSCLYLISTYNYLLFHGIIEVTTIVIVFAVFIIVWNTRRNITNVFFLVIGISCLFIGGIDLIHTLAYKGMGIFPGDSANLPTQLWIAARYYQSIAFFIATLLIGKSLTKDRKYDAGIIFAACAAGFVLILASIFAWQNFPVCYIDGTGLTGFKVASEYVISLIMLSTILLLVHRRRAFDPSVWKLLVAAMVFLIAGELAFTSYVSVYGFANMVGHLAKLVSAYFFYRAIVVVAITRPFDLLFRDVKEKEEALAQSEARYAITLDAVNDGLWDWDVPTGNALFSSRWYTMLGYEPHELPGNYTTFRKLVHPDDLGLVEATIQNHIRLKDAGYSVEMRMKTKSGAWKWIQTRGKVIERDAEDNPVRMVGTHTDVTERKKAEATLRETSEYLQNLIRYANAPIIVWNPEFRITEFNRAFESLTGLPRDQAIGRHLHILFPQDSCNSSMDQIRRTLHGEQWEVVEIPIRHVSGQTKTVLWNSANIRDSQGTIIATIAQGQDITERVEAEDTIRSAKAFLDMVVDMSPFSMWICDKEGTVIRVNHSLCKTINLTPDAIIGKYNVLEDVNLKNAGVMPDIRAVFEKHIPARFTIPWKAADAGNVDFRGARDMYIDVAIFPILDAHGDLTNAVCQWIDITERKNAELQRERLISELEQKNAELERFTYTVSHDLKSPVITIRGFLGLLAEDAKKGDINQMDSDIRRIFSATDKMQALLEDLLTLSRIGRIVNPPERISFGTIAGEAIEQLAGVIRKHGVTVTIAPDLPEVFVDHTRIREVLVNLIENAIKFRGDQPAPTIEIGMRCDESEPVFFVKDNGIGIEEMYTKKIFDLFEKLDAKTEGTGVGLAIVKRIIEVHGGTIWVESPGHGLGSTFCFTLPVTGSKCIYNPEKGKKE